MGMASNGAQTLLIDADDTLWENNIYFERAIARFISFLNHHEYSAEQVREILNDVERENIVTHGYGLHSFAHALVGCFPIPFEGFRRITVHALAIFIDYAEIILGAGISFFCREPKPLHGLRRIFFDALAGRIGEAQVHLCFQISFIGRFAIPLH